MIYPGLGPMLNPMLPFNLPVSRQWPINTQMWHAQDELGRASFGYAYPGQAAANYRDAAGNMIGSWSYINPNGKLVATSYVADHRGFHVQSNDLPVAPVDNWVAPVAPVAPAVVAPTPTIKDVSSEIKPAITTPIKTPEPVTKDPAAVIIADDWQCLQARRKRQTDQVAYMVASKESNENAYPFMVALVTYDADLTVSAHACGASLISSTKLLTAAHCITKNESKIYEPDNYYAHLGMHFRTAKYTDAKAIRKIVAYKIHENYDPSTKANDMAILTLESPVEFTETISPVCLPQKCMDVKFTGRSVTAMGWGLTKENGTVSDYLRSASFNVISKAKCSKHYDDLTDHMFCTYKEGQDTCQGDSGGPLVTDHGSDGLNCRFVQVGVVSYGNGCARKGVPGVYMKVTSFVPWIQRNLDLLQLID
ncbi:transmembrane protease serine 9-like isoform X2 [Daphnia pulicaria]|uniref:transmembrane protease serine 9-like isoform X2 n=1 Tax=Daphnia pulicaria TaxID=35523 RepID=UPI001EEC5C7C|nr:transmembrane protease serine 9-like isoform X2 [Daphnia pulicaria]